EEEEEEKGGRAAQAARRFLAPSGLPSGALWTWLYSPARDPGGACVKGGAADGGRRRRAAGEEGGARRGRAWRGRHAQRTRGLASAPLSARGRRRGGGEALTARPPCAAGA
ncbi:unnamed protein product, partial [Prorocentrum cordatum]